MNFVKIGKMPLVDTGLVIEKAEPRERITLQQISEAKQEKDKADESKPGE